MDHGRERENRGQKRPVTVGRLKCQTRDDDNRKLDISLTDQAQAGNDFDEAWIERPGRWIT